MFKWVSWVIRMGATALLLSFLCIWTTGYIVNSYVETIVKQLDLPIETQPFALSGVWGTLWGAQKPPKAEASVSKTPTDKSVQEENASPSSPTTDQPTDNHVSNETDKGHFGNIPDHNAAVEPEDGASPDAGGEVGSKPVFNSGEIANQLSDEERQSLYALVVSKLNPEQLKQLSDSLKGGLTAGELTQMESMLKSTLTDSEYSQMMELLQGSKKTDTEALPE
ncbi:hypothetical protein [Cohnella abietis]|uniref:Spore coat protein n=1 Tax=Cohnella abietis TaxID=2507935 RepID=A0A3T1DF62_9BACL|nr:hypothetical protein [Cohnella abietis]BBI36770.1 hypothetical protein KCTCHS21_61690 [Cohnella abietis]